MTALALKRTKIGWVVNIGLKIIVIILYLWYISNIYKREMYSYIHKSYVACWNVFHICEEVLVVVLSPGVHGLESRFTVNQQIIHCEVGLKCLDVWGHGDSCLLCPVGIHLLSGRVMDGLLKGPSNPKGFVPTNHHPEDSPAKCHWDIYQLQRDWNKSKKQKQEKVVKNNFRRHEATSKTHKTNSETTQPERDIKQPQRDTRQPQRGKITSKRYKTNLEIQPQRDTIQTQRHNTTSKRWHNLKKTQNN